MDEDEGLAPDFERATENLEEGLETCQKIVSDYRSALLGLFDKPETPTDR